MLVNMKRNISRSLVQREYMLINENIGIELWEDRIGRVIGIDDDGIIRINFSDGTTYETEDDSELERYANIEEIIKYNKELRLNKLKQLNKKKS